MAATCSWPQCLAPVSPHVPGHRAGPCSSQGSHTSGQLLACGTWLFIGTNTVTGAHLCLQEHTQIFGNTHVHTWAHTHCQVHTAVYRHTHVAACTHTALQTCTPAHTCPGTCCLPSCSPHPPTRGQALLLSPSPSLPPWSLNPGSVAGMHLLTPTDFPLISQEHTRVPRAAGPR